MKRIVSFLWLSLLLVGSYVLPVQSQLTRGSKVLAPQGLGEAGGDFLIEQVQSSLNAIPYAASFTANAKISVLGLRGAIKKMQVILQSDRRVTKVTSGNSSSPVTFSHVGSFLVLDLDSPLRKGETQTFNVSYSGKLHSLSQKLTRDYQIEKYTLSYTMIPRSGSMEGSANLVLVGVKDPLFGPDFDKLYQPPMDSTDPLLMVSLNNDYAVENIQLNNQQAKFFHAAGGVHITLPKKMKPNDRNTLQIKYNGKVRHIDKNLLWDIFEPIDRIFRYYPYGPMNYGAY